MHSLARACWFVLGMAGAGCGRDSDARAVAPAPASPTAGAASAARSATAELDRFRVGLVPLDTLQFASSSRDGVIAGLRRALENSDTAHIRNTALARAEFAYLYYPGHSQSLVPYELPAHLMWYQMIAANEKGAGRLLERFGGKKFAYRNYTCRESVKVSARASEIRGCTIEYADSDGKVRRAQFFPAIVVVDGRYKILGYGNDF